MSYDPSHRLPPRQERWPQATPAEGWPPYQDGEGDQAGRQRNRAQRAAGSHRRQAGPRSAVATAALPTVRNARGTADAYGADGYRGTDAYGTDGYGTDGYDTGVYRTGAYPSSGNPGSTGGYAAAADDFPGIGYDGTNSAYGTANGGYGAAGHAANGYDWTGNGYAGAADGYATARNGHAGPGNGHAGSQNGYGRATDGYAGATDGYAGAADGLDRAQDGFDGVPDGYPATGAYLGPGSYTETAYSDPGYSDPGYSDPGYSDPGYSDPGYSGSGYPGDTYSGPGYSGSGYSDPTLTAPDAGIRPDSWQAEQALRRAAGQRGPMVSAAAEFLATAVVIGVSTLAAGVLKSSVIPVSAMGAVFIDRTPAALRGFALHHFGTHGRAVLLLGMYAVIAVVALAIGAAARRAAALGVAGIAAFALAAAFVSVTRPASHVSDVMPAAIGGLAGVAALLWLVRASVPLQETSPLRPVRSGTRRRTG